MFEMGSGPVGGGKVDNNKREAERTVENEVEEWGSRNGMNMSDQSRQAQWTVMSWSGTVSQVKGLQ